MPTKIEILYWEDGLKKISLTNLIREFGGLSLREGKDKVDAFVGGNRVVLEILNEKSAADFIRQAAELGAKCELVQNL